MNNEIPSRKENQSDSTVASGKFSNWNWANSNKLELLLLWQVELLGKDKNCSEHSTELSINQSRFIKRGILVPWGWCPGNSLCWFTPGFLDNSSHGLCTQMQLIATSHKQKSVNGHKREITSIGTLNAVLVKIVSFKHTSANCLYWSFVRGTSSHRTRPVIWILRWKLIFWKK